MFSPVHIPESAELQIVIKFLTSYRHSRCKRHPRCPQRSRCTVVIYLQRLFITGLGSLPFYCWSTVGTSSIQTRQIVLILLQKQFQRLVDFKVIWQNLDLCLKNDVTEPSYLSRQCTVAVSTLTPVALQVFFTH